MADRIPVAAAERLGKAHSYDQVIILARHVGEPGQEWITTWGKNPTHCAAAAQIGNALAENVTPALERLQNRVAELEAHVRKWKCPSCGGSGIYLQRSRAGDERLICKVCDGTGLHPQAKQALASGAAA